MWQQRGAVLGLLSFFGFQVYQIGAAVYTGRVDSPYMQSTYRQQVEEKVKEEYTTKDNVIDKRDWYQKEDDSYLVSLVEVEMWWHMQIYDTWICYFHRPIAHCVFANLLPSFSSFVTTEKSSPS